MDQHFALIVAGGTGKRMGSKIPKQLIPIAGIPVLVRTVQVFLDFSKDLTLILSLNSGIIDYWESIRNEHFNPIDLARIFVVEGGETRTESVKNGLQKIKSSTSFNEESLVAIHDGVRPFVTQNTLHSAFKKAMELGNAVVGIKPKSSIRKITETGTHSVDRTQYYIVQTPQVFNLETIHEAYSALGSESFSDDASLGEKYGLKIQMVEGSYENIKITTPEDLAIGMEIIKRRQLPES